MFRPKTANKEYEKYMLPKNRKEVFFVIKNNWVRFLLYGCLVLVISLPVQLSAVLGDLYQLRLSQALSAGEITADNAVLLASSSENTLALADIPLLVIFSVLFSGLLHVIRQHAWEESVYFRYEYFKGIRQNAGSFAIFGLLTGMVRFGCVWFRNMFIVNGGDIYYYAGYIPAVWVCVLLVPAAAYLTVCIPVYDVKFYQNVKYAFMLYFHSFFRTLSAVMICGAVFIFTVLPDFYLRMTGRVVSGMAAPFIALGWFLFAYDRMDETINEKLYLQLVGRGITVE